MKLPSLKPAPTGRRISGQAILTRAALFATLVALVAFAPGVVALTAAIALGVVLGVLLLGVAGVAMVRRTTKRTLAQYPHLRRLGMRFERQYSGTRIIAVDEAPNGQVSLHLAWHDQSTIELDANGIPDGSSTDGAGTLTWPIPVSGSSSVERAMLLDLADHDVTLVEQGAIMPQGPVVMTRELTTDSGLVLRADAPVLI